MMTTSNTPQQSIAGPSVNDATEQILQMMKLGSPVKSSYRKFTVDQFRSALEKMGIDAGKENYEEKAIRLAELYAKSTKHRNELLRAIDITPPKQESFFVRAEKRLLEGSHSEDVFEKNVKLLFATQSLIGFLDRTEDDERTRPITLDDQLAIATICMALDHGIPNLELAIILMQRLISCGYSLGSIVYADCRYGHYAGDTDLLTHSLPVERSFAVSIESLFFCRSTADRTEVATAV